MIRTGVVRAVPISLLQTSVPVTLDPMSTCGACAKSGGCGIHLLPTTHDELILECQLRTDTPVRVGDPVRIELPEPKSDWLALVALAYGLPTLGMLIGALLGDWAANLLQLSSQRALLSLIGFIVGLAGGLFAWVRAQGIITARHSDTRPSSMATIVAVRDEPDSQ